MIEDEKYFMGRDILNQCYSYNQLLYFYREFGLKGIDRYINELQNESKSKSREIERLNKELQNLEKLNNANYQSFIEVNNIINELEKDVKERIDFYKQEIKEFQDDLFTSNYEEIEDAKNEIKIRRCHIIELEDTLDKIEELKGSDK